MTRSERRSPERDVVPPTPRVLSGVRTRMVVETFRWATVTSGSAAAAVTSRYPRSSTVSGATVGAGVAPDGFASSSSHAARSPPVAAVTVAVDAPRAARTEWTCSRVNPAWTCTVGSADHAAVARYSRDMQCESSGCQSRAVTSDTPGRHRRARDGPIGTAPRVRDSRTARVAWRPGGNAWGRPGRRSCWWRCRVGS